jgi:general secretion pathway protein C
VAEAPQPAPDARFQLIGVVSPRGPSSSREGLALIAVDGKPAKAFRIGAAVTGDTVLQAVRQRGATLGPRGGAAQVALELAAPPAAATGTLPSIGGDGGGQQPARPLRNGQPGMPGGGMQQGGPMANGDMAPPISQPQQAETMQTR